MLKITVYPVEFWDDDKQEFVYRGKKQTLQLEHSLISLSKWESKWKKSFLSTKNLTDDELIDYIRCMTVTPNVDPEVYSCLSKDNFKEIDSYINDSMTATTFSKKTSGKVNKRIVTSELIYYWMILYGIPIDREKWHLNRLLTLIEVCDQENNPKKLKPNELMRRNAELNAIRRKQLGTRG